MKPFALILFMLAAPAHAAGLEKDQHVTNQLVAAQVGDIIRNTCPSISARMFVVLREMFALKNYAQDQGYTEPQVKAFLANKTQKKRIKTLAQDYLKQAGAVAGDRDSYCKVGRAEIAAKTVTGSLLWSSQ